MSNTTPELDSSVFEQLKVQVVMAARFCDDRQILDLADSLHEALRKRRREARAARILAGIHRSNIATDAPSLDERPVPLSDRPRLRLISSRR